MSFNGKAFMDQDFLLETQTAKTLYHEGAKDEPIYDYHCHLIPAQIAEKVIPSFRPDKALNVNLPGFAAYIKSLADASGQAIQSVAGVLAALEKRLDFFVAQGCCISDHALEYPPFVIAPDGEIEKTFQDALAGKAVSTEAADAYKTKVLCALAG